MTKRDRFLQFIADGPRLCEGAMGIMLFRAGYRGANCTEWSATNPSAVTAVHAAYRAIGAELFQTNTFVANRPMLEGAGLADRAEDIWRGSVRAAREAIGDDGFLAANGGPTGLLLEPYGETPAEKARDVFAEQIGVQVEEGVDWVILETFMALEEAEAALAGARQVAPDLAIAVTMAFDRNGRTQFGVSGQQAAERLAKAGADIVGANCGNPDDALVGLAAMAEVAERPLMVQLNAGVPELVDGVDRFPATPEQYLEYAKRALDCRVAIIGGCCGATPEHMRPVAEEVRRRR
jgi:methionine synthase I (cobalamin-dependent)